MDKLLKVINSPASGCGSCHTTGCGTCTTEAPKSEARTTFSRRDLGRGILAASVSTLLVGCSDKASTEKAAEAAPAAPALSPDLAVVQQSKGPIMTTLEEFYTMGPGPSTTQTVGQMRTTYDFSQRPPKLPGNQLRRATAPKALLLGIWSAPGK